MSTIVYKKNNNIISSPVISINKLGEYLTTKPAKQRKILEQFKYPLENKFCYTRYNEAIAAIKQFLINNLDKTILEDCIQRLKLKEVNNSYQQTTKDSSIDALNKVLNFNFSNFRFNKYSIESNSNKKRKLYIKGVKISVNPDVIIKYNIRDKVFIGSMKIQISKSNKLNRESKNYNMDYNKYIECREYISSILKHFTENYSENNETVKSALCLTYDIFNDSLFPCPNSIKRRFQNIEAGCENISAIWDSI